MMMDENFDYQQALDDPCKIFGEPVNVLSHPGLNAEQKRKILESWRLDAVRLSETEGENMGGGESSMLQRVGDALLMLERETGVEAAHTRTIT